MNDHIYKIKKTRKKEDRMPPKLGIFLISTAICFCYPNKIAVDSIL